MHRSILPVSGLGLLLIVLLCSSLSGQDQASTQREPDFNLRLRYQEPTTLDPNLYQYRFRDETWKAAETAIIVCDFWDYHHCLNAVRRMKEFGPRLNQLVEQGRRQGATIIHAPSDCMAAYKDHPARLRVLELPAGDPPEFLNGWCSQLPEEEAAGYPIDQSDGGEDDDPDEHRQWAAKLKEMGRNPAMPWQKQSDMIRIDSEQDFISDRGDEVWRVLKSRGIENVILVGVHANMCVLGRPFGLRQMKRLGKRVALVRDMTDSMYNPRRWPFVSHYAGNDLVISHIEKAVCPTLTSDQILGGRPFVFAGDRRPHLAVVIGESEYRTAETLPGWIEGQLPEFRTSFILADADDRNHFPGLEQVKEADLLLLSVRRRVLPPESIQIFKDFVAAGKPVVGIRTASHAFSLRNSEPPEGYVDWKSLDADVFGGNYTNHHGNDLKSRVEFTDLAARHPITRHRAGQSGESDDEDHLEKKTFGQAGSLYKTSPLAEGTEVLLTGTVLGHPPEPVAWTFQRIDGGRSFYTSLGHPGDFQNPEFTALLKNAIRWAAERTDADKTDATPATSAGFWRIVDSVRLPDETERLDYEFDSKSKLQGLHAKVAFRKAIRLSRDWLMSDLKILTGPSIQGVWLNGRALESTSEGEERSFRIPAAMLDSNEVHWLVLGGKFPEPDRKDDKSKQSIPVRVVGDDRSVELDGPWEWMAVGDGMKEAAKVHLPAKFGASPRIFVDID